MNNRLNKIKQAIFSSPYRYYFLITFIIYLGVAIWANQLYITGIKVLFDYKPSFLIPYLVFNLIILLLVPLIVNLVIIKIKDLRDISKAGGSAGFLGIFAGLLGSACPGCFAGLFPAFLGLFGVSATLGNLPFYGLEIQGLSIVLLMVSVWLLTRETVCKVEIKSIKSNKK